MSLPPSAKWIGLALLGLVIAGTVAIVASNLASQQIGIASESITAGDRLAPAVRSASQEAAAGQGQAQPPRSTDTRTTTQTTPTAPPPETTTTPTTVEPPTTGHGSGEPGDDHGSGGHGADD